jgi:hypothetical protein
MPRPLIRLGTIYANRANTVTKLDLTGIEPKMFVSGTGINPGTYVEKIVREGIYGRNKRQHVPDQVILNQPVTAAVFTQPPINDVQWGTIELTFTKAPWGTLERTVHGRDSA